MNGMPAGEEEFECNGGWWYDCKGGEPLGRKKTFPECMWDDFKINIIGEKNDLPVHFCDNCDLPIKIYGCVIPRKHAFCYDCANLYENNGGKVCPGCSISVLRTEEHT